MSRNQTVWVDEERCTGCGACVEVCPVGAIALLDGRARVDDELCTGCQVCVDACPQDAIQPLVHGEIVSAQERPVPSVQQGRPLAEAAGVAIAAASVGVLARVTGALVRAAGRWLAQGPDEGRGQPTAGGPLRLSSEAERNSVLAQPGARPTGRSRGGRGRQARRRHRGG